MSIDNRSCRENDPKWLFPCSCDACSRAAAARWHGYMDRVFDGSLSLSEAQNLMAQECSISRVPR